MYGVYLEFILLLIKNARVHLQIDGYLSEKQGVFMCYSEEGKGIILLILNFY